MRLFTLSLMNRSAEISHSAPAIVLATKEDGESHTSDPAPNMAAGANRHRRLIADAHFRARLTVISAVRGVSTTMAQLTLSVYLLGLATAIGEPKV